MSKAVFLDRDGVLNVEVGDYVWKLEELIIEERVTESLLALKSAGFRMIVVTNQAGIAKGLYTAEDVWACHQKIQNACGGLLDMLYFSPWHPVASESLGRKPGTLLFEKGLARFGVDPALSWMIGDKERDLIPAHKLGMKTIRVGPKHDMTIAPYWVKNLAEATPIILQQDQERTIT